ncbi:MAG: hypothetical protein II937_01030 [Bacteroidales bacterium]|nr:hypothetical protein [Bacteroidales bacterium]
MTEKVKNQSVVLPAQKVIKKKYVKPDFEVIELNMEAPLLMGSGDATTNSRFRTINREDW